MAEADLYQDENVSIDYTPVAAVAAGEIRKLADGRAGFAPTAIAAGVKGAIQTRGVCTVTKNATTVFLEGQPAYWDHSANEAVHTPASDEDFYLGQVMYGDAASTDTTMKVALNQWPEYKIDINRGRQEDSSTSLIVLTSGTPDIKKIGSSTRMSFSATAEAQKVDLLSTQGFALGSDWIAEFAFTIVDDGDAAALDFNIGVANGTHASDADAITESVFIHTDGNVVNLLAESDDGTTEVAATDTTIDYTLGEQVHVVIDGRDPSDVQIYINGALVLSGTTFDISAATGPLKLLAHLEKSSDNTTAEIYVDVMRVRTVDL